MTNFADFLNPEQLAAVTAGDGPLLVLAAAGTGKTQTLTYRVAYLMEQGVDPRSLLLLTFTNRAAREMLERAERLVGPAIATLWSGTFHHVCHRILRRYAEAVGYTPRFVILDREDSQSLLNKCLKATVTDTKHFPKKEVLASLIGKAANTQRDLRELVEEADFRDDVDPEVVLSIAQKYAAAKREANAMDFDDLLVLTLKLLKEHPEVLASYAERFRYVLVDEYQDTNTIQAQLVDLLSSRHRNLMAVGDDFQCIYSWRGADFRNIMEFPKRWAGCKIIKLERNYRSVPEVLDLANAAIKGNPDQFQKTLLPTRDSLQEKPLVAFLQGAQEQSQMVVRQIARFQAQGYALNDITVLYRSHFHVMELEQELRRQKIPYTLTSGQGFFDSIQTKDVIAFLRLCSGDADLFAFIRVMGLLQGVGLKTAEKLWDKLGGAFDSANPEARAALCNLMPKKAKEDWQVLDGLLAQYHAEGLEENGNRATTLFLDKWYAAYLQRNYENAEERMESVAAFAIQFKRGQRVREYLYDVALMSNVDAETAALLKDDPGVHLSTVHQAKGLEWPCVMILWCNEEMFPSAKGLREGQEEEERRLFYVAVTRAKDHLVLCVPGTRYLPGNGGTLYLRPSRFIKEIPREQISTRYGFY